MKKFSWMGVTSWHTIRRRHPACPSRILKLQASADYSQGVLIMDIRIHELSCHVVFVILRRRRKAWIARNAEVDVMVVIGSCMSGAPSEGDGVRDIGGTEDCDILMEVVNG